ncbi:MAG: sugar transferase [candidate division Zixibacteria bacterium]|nr:sugar transferase [candidate division Zixibacteria bacterium]
MKRLFDIVVSFFGLVFISPVLLLLSILIIATMGWPVFFCQNRVGKDGVPFKIIKFRSMVKNAESKGPAFTSGGDPRITPIGKFMRKMKLDELPQLLNVFWGDMSFVGPRPEVPKYVSLYNEEQIRVLSVRPGLTDPASIVYRNEEEILAGYDDKETVYVEKIMPAKLKLNLSYIEKASFFRDLGLIIKTIRKVVSRT